MPNPWVALRARPDLLLLRAWISEPGRYYDSERAIVMRRGLLLCEERRYLWHELVHADRRDRACHMDDRVEGSVDREAVRRAIPTSSLEWAWPRADHWCDLADLLKLPEGWVRWRWQISAPYEKALLRRMEERCEHSA